MVPDVLFEHKSLVASKLADCLRDNGYTNVSFARKAGIPLVVTENLLAGNVGNKETFDRWLEQAL